MTTGMSEVLLPQGADGWLPSGFTGPSLSLMPRNQTQPALTDLDVVSPFTDGAGRNAAQ